VGLADEADGAQFVSQRPAAAAPLRGPLKLMRRPRGLGIALAGSRSDPPTSASRVSQRSARHTWRSKTVTTVATAAALAAATAIASLAVSREQDQRRLEGAPPVTSLNPRPASPTRPWPRSHSQARSLHVARHPPDHATAPHRRAVASLGSRPSSPVGEQPPAAAPTHVARVAPVQQAPPETEAPATPAQRSSLAASSPTPAGGRVVSPAVGGAP
jgi:hypothetical protein